MTASILEFGRKPDMPHTPHVTFPPMVAERIVRFLDAGHTGRVVLHVKCGEVRSFEITEIGDARAALDIGTPQGQD